MHVQSHHPSYVEQSVNVCLRDLFKLLCQSGLYHVPPDTVVLCEQVIQQPAVLQEKKHSGTDLLIQRSTRTQMCMFPWILYFSLKETSNKGKITQSYVLSRVYWRHLQLKCTKYHNASTVTVYHYTVRKETHLPCSFATLTLVVAGRTMSYFSHLCGYEVMQPANHGPLRVVSEFHVKFSSRWRLWRVVCGAFQQ